MHRPKENISLSQDEEATWAESTDNPLDCGFNKND